MVWLESSIADHKCFSENIVLSKSYLLILTPNVADHLSKSTFHAKVFSWLEIILGFKWVKSLKWYTMNWVDQMRALVILPDNFWTNLV